MARRLLHFFVLGGLILVSKAAALALLPTERPEVRVRVPEGASEAERADLVDEAIAVEEGIRFGWARTDPVIRRRLVQNLRFVRAGGEGAANPEATDGDPSLPDPAMDSDAVEEAIALGMHRRDPVVRARLVQRVERTLASDPSLRAVDDATLREHLRAHRARFERGGWVRFAQAAILGDGGAASSERAEALRASLQQRDPPDGEAHRLGDPLGLFPAVDSGTVEHLDRRYGPGFGEKVAAAPEQEWSVPIPSSFGLHVVKVLERRERRLPELARVRRSVLFDYRQVKGRELLEERFAQLRSRYRVVVVEVPE